MPTDEQGRTVELNTLKHWLTDDGWYQWKDDIDAALSVKIEDELLARKVMLIKEQLQQNRVIRNTAFEDITEKPFDSSASAVSAFFKASAEERALMQIEKVIEDLAKTETTDLQKQFRELAERAGASEIIEEATITEETEKGKDDE